MRADQRSTHSLAGPGSAYARDDVRAWARIAELTRAALEGRSVLDLAQAAVKVISDELADVDYVCVGEIVPTGLRRIAALGIPQREVPRMLEPDPSTYLAMRSVRVGECVVVADWDTEARFFEREWLQLGCIKSSAFSPIRTYPSGRVFGFLGMHSRRAREFAEQDIVYLEIVANVLGEAIAREQAQETAARHLEQFHALARDITYNQRTEQECMVVHNRVLAELEELRELIARLTATHQRQIATVVVEGQLTARERQILNMIARGWSNREIAAELGVSRGNVKNQVSRLLAKLDVSDRTQAATQAVRLGLVDAQ